MNISDPEQHNETLSAFIDAEQSELETAQMVSALLNDKEFKARYIRMQLMNDSLHNQVHSALLKTDVLKSVATQVNALPACHVNALQGELHTGVIEDVTKSSLFKTIMGHKLVSGLSVAASVMFATLFTLQQFNNEPQTAQLAGNNKGIADDTPSLIQAPAQLPAALVSGSGANMSSSDIKQQYQWVEADPELARQVRQYLSDHEIHRAAYTLQPQIRAASYQVNE